MLYKDKSNSGLYLVTHQSILDELRKNSAFVTAAMTDNVPMLNKKEIQEKNLCSMSLQSEKQRKAKIGILLS